MSDIVPLNVGGKQMECLRSTLCIVHGSLLEEMFSGPRYQELRRDRSGNIFLDWQPTFFECVLDYLRGLEQAGVGRPPSQRIAHNFHGQQRDDFMNYVRYLCLPDEIFLCEPTIAASVLDADVMAAAAAASAAAVSGGALSALGAASASASAATVATGTAWFAGTGVASIAIPSGGLLVAETTTLAVSSVAAPGLAGWLGATTVTASVTTTASTTTLGVAAAGLSGGLLLGGAVMGMAYAAKKLYNWINS